MLRSRSRFSYFSVLNNLRLKNERKNKAKSRRDFKRQELAKIRNDSATLHTPKHLKVAFTVSPCVGGVTFCNLVSFMFYLLKTYNSLLQATKYKSGIKRKFEDNFKEGGQRNWLQVGGENNGF